MARIGRNHPCPCGSGKKYKKCHGAFVAGESPLPAGLEQRLSEIEALDARRKQQHGLGRPIIAAKLKDHQLVAVGSRLYYSKAWKTFNDFLRDHFFGFLGREWLDAERTKLPENRHRIVRWFDDASDALLRLGKKSGDIYSAPMTGATRAFVNLAYNIYMIAHHAGKGGNEVVKGYIDRLKSARADTFIGALFETYAAAAFLKAGFELEFENERDGTVSHVEFVALYPQTGKRFSVEVKARERSAGNEEIDDIKRLRVGNKLNKALGKKAVHPRVVIIEVNVPEVVTSYEGWPSAAMEQIRYSEKHVFMDGAQKPSAYVFVTNHPFHSNLASPDAGMQVLATGFHISGFGPDSRHSSYKGVLESRAKHKEMFALMKSMQTHYEIPSTFDGEMPELAFQEARDLPRLRFGRWYMVPTADGQEVPGRLYEAIVREDTKEVLGCYELATGENILATCPISDTELSAYRRYPEKSESQAAGPTRSLNSATSFTIPTRIRRARSYWSGYLRRRISSSCGHCRRRISLLSYASAGPLPRFIRQEERLIKVDACPAQL